MFDSRLDVKEYLEVVANRLSCEDFAELLNLFLVVIGHVLRFTPSLSLQPTTRRYSNSTQGLETLRA